MTCIDSRELTGGPGSWTSLSVAFIVFLYFYVHHRAPSTSAPSVSAIKPSGPLPRSHAKDHAGGDTKQGAVPEGEGVRQDAGIPQEHEVQLGASALLGLRGSADGSHGEKEYIHDLTGINNHTGHHAGSGGSEGSQTSQPAPTTGPRSKRRHVHRDVSPACVSPPALPNLKLKLTIQREALIQYTHSAPAIPSAPPHVAPEEMHEIDRIRAELQVGMARQPPPHMAVSSRQPRSASRRAVTPSNPAVQAMPSSQQQVAMFTRDVKARVCEPCGKTFVDQYSLNQVSFVLHLEDVIGSSLFGSTRLLRTTRPRARTTKHL